MGILRLRVDLVDAPDEAIAGIDVIVAPARNEVGLTARD
jgi:hypothetical protein